MYGCSFKSGSLIAALRNRLPVITSRGKFTSALLKLDENICFADFNSAKSVKAAMLSLLKNEELRKR